MENIPKGYALTVHTWENDMDLTKRITKYGLTEDEVKFYIALINAYNGTGLPNTFGLDLTEEHGKDIFTKACSEFPIPESINIDFDDELPSEWVIFEVLPEFEIEGEDSLRVVDKIEVSYYPEEVIIKREIVTSKFPELKNTY